MAQPSANVNGAALCVRNPQQAPTYVMRHGFSQLLKEQSPNLMSEITQMLADLKQDQAQEYAEQLPPVQAEIEKQKQDYLKERQAVYDQYASSQKELGIPQEAIDDVLSEMKVNTNKQLEIMNQHAEQRLSVLHAEIELKFKDRKDEVMKHLHDNIPPEVFQHMKSYYEVYHAHCKTEIGNEQEAKERADKDIFVVILFQLVNSELMNYLRHEQTDPSISSDFGNYGKMLKNCFYDGGSMDVTVNSENEITSINVNNAGFGQGEFDQDQLSLFIDVMHDENVQSLALSQETVEKAKEPAIKAESDYLEPFKERYGNFVVGNHNFAEFIELMQSKHLDQTAISKLDKFYEEAQQLCFGDDSVLSVQQFRNITDDLAKIDYPSALYFKGKELVGEQQFSVPELQVYTPDPAQGIALLSKLKHTHLDEIVRSEHTQSLPPVELADLNKNYNDTLAQFNNIQERYDQVDTYKHKKTSSVSGFLGHMAHKHFSDSKRETQIKILQDIIDDPKYSSDPTKGVPILLGAMEVIKAQVEGDQTMKKVESRLITVMEQMKEQILESVKQDYGHDPQEMFHSQECQDAFEAHLKQSGGKNYDQKVTESLKEIISSSKEAKEEPKPLGIKNR